MSDYSPPVSLGSGASPEAHRRRSGMRRPRARFAALLPGGPGQPSGPTTGVCLQWLDGAGCAGAKAPPIREAPLKGVLPSRNGRTAPGTEIAAGGAPGGVFPRSQGERERSQAFRAGSHPLRRPRKPPRFPALYSPFGVEALGVEALGVDGGNDRPRPGLTKNGRAERWLVSPKRAARRRG